MREKVRLINNVENFLISKKGYKKSYVRTFLGILLCCAVFITTLVFAYELGPLSKDPAPIPNPDDLKYILSQHANLLTVASKLSIAGICICLSPFLCSIAIWMIGINQVSKSKYFHLFMWFMVIVAGIIAMVAMIFLIRSCIFNEIEFPPQEEETTPNNQSGIINLISSIIL